MPRSARHLLPLLLLSALALAACARQQQSYYVIDPQTGQQVPVVQQYSQAQQPAQVYAGPEQYLQAQGAPPQAAQAPASRGLFNAQAQQPYAQGYQPAPQNDNARGLFNSRRSAPPQYAAQPSQSYVLQYRPPAAAAPQAMGGPYQPAPYGYGYGYASAQPAYQTAYTLDAGDKVRVIVYGQEGISGSYMVDAGGNVNLPLAGAVPARGFTTDQLARMIGERLKQGYVREPHVTVSMETYRPFFIMGEVTTPGQYPYVPNMTAENAVAIAGGFSPRAQKQAIELTRVANGQRFTSQVPLNTPLQPGDTVVVKERWF